MGTKQEVLSLLEEERGAYISGEDIAERLGVSRTAVWKAINSLRREGHEITATTNRGYALCAESEKLSAQSVRKRLRGAASLCRIETVGTVGSTNIEVKKRGESGEAEGLVLIAEAQSAGRGRIGRSFYSPGKTGLYMSILLRPKLRADSALFITTAAAVAVARAIEEETGREASIKWVNDIYCGGLKVCGILTEASTDFETGTLAYAVPGIGVNISEPEGGMPEELRGIAGSLCGREKTGDLKSRLAAGILNHFFEYYGKLESKSFIEEYRKRSFLIGQEVCFTRDGETLRAKVLDVDDEARLLIQYADGRTEALGAGEVSVKKQ